MSCHEIFSGNSLWMTSAWGIPSAPRTRVACLLLRPRGGPLFPCLLHESWPCPRDWPDAHPHLLRPSSCWCPTYPSAPGLPTSSSTWGIGTQQKQKERDSFAGVVKESIESWAPLWKVIKSFYKSLIKSSKTPPDETPQWLNIPEDCWLNMAPPQVRGRRPFFHHPLGEPGVFSSNEQTMSFRTPRKLLCLSFPCGQNLHRPPASSLLG